MKRVMAWLRADPGLALLALALVAAAVLYAPVIGRGLVNYDDAWLVRDNWILRNASWASLHAVWFDLGPETRFILGAEYLPVRDLSVMLDFLIWGSWFGGHHLTSLVIYLAAIAVWFAALDGFGVDRKVLGVMALLWALHPAHAESVAWVAERKGVLGALFAGVAVLAYARFRAGRSSGWVALAAVAAVCAVWSKALSAFAIAALGGLELALPALRVSWRRSALGLGVIAAFGIAAFLPVFAIALDEGVLGADGQAAPAGWAAMVIGILGFDLRASVLLVRNSPSYPIAIEGPTAVDLVIGAFGLVALCAVAVVPARGWWRPPPALRAAAVLFLFTWFPSSRIALPLRAVLVADRYLLLPTLGIALAAAVGLVRISSARARRALIAAIALAAALRTVDAHTNWRDNLTLWQRASKTSPYDANAWSMYAESLMEIGRYDIAFDVLHEALKYTPRAPRILLRKALLAVWGGQKSQALRAMRQAAEAGEPRAMINLGLLLLDAKQPEEGLVWANKGLAALPYQASPYRAIGRLELALARPDRALAAFERALHFEPANTVNRFNLAVTLIALNRTAEARVELERCLVDPAFAWRAQKLLSALSR